MAETRKMANRRVVVTGSGTGIGREIALEFARQGAAVALHCSRSAEGAQSAADEVRRSGGRAAVFRADFDDLDQVAQFAEKSIEFLGGVDVLINNAGITFNAPFLEIAPAQFDRLLHVNLRAQFFLTQRVVRTMLQQGHGAIVNITSIHGLQGVTEHSLYAATKGAIISYTRALAVELAHKGIRVNAIAPGAIPVESHKKALPDLTEERAQEWAQKTIPVGRAGTPLDIAKLAVFLCSDDAGFIVGQTLVADGGTTALMSLMPDFQHPMSARFGRDYV